MSIMKLLDCHITSFRFIYVLQESKFAKFSGLLVAPEPERSKQSLLMFIAEIC